MPGSPLIVIGASAGGIEALHGLLPRLPPGLGAALGVVLHRPPVSDDDRLARVIRRDARLPVMEATHGEVLVPGRVYVAPANVHLKVHDDHLVLDPGPRENGARPAIDALFRSAAYARGSGVIGVLLSGTLSDGTAGMAAIRAQGGRTIVQEPREALFADMPRSAAEAVDVDDVLPVAAIAERLVQLTGELASANYAPGGTSSIDVLTPFVCPECGGSLRESNHGKVAVYRCRTGHAYSEDGLLLKQDEELENALWGAIRSLQERADLCDRVARRLSGRSLSEQAARLREEAGHARDRAKVIRLALNDEGELQRIAADNRLAEDAG